MCDKVERLFQKREKENMLIWLFEGVQDGGLRPTYAAKKANLTLNEFKQEMRLRGYTVPERRKRTADKAN